MFQGVLPEKVLLLILKVLVCALLFLGVLSPLKLLQFNSTFDENYHIQPCEYLKFHCEINHDKNGIGCL